MAIDLTRPVALALGPGKPAGPEYLVRVHVSSDRLGVATGTARPEQQMHEALLQRDGPARVLVEGPAGSGKTSLILRAIAETAKDDSRPLEVLMLRCGQDPSKLASGASFVKLVIDALKAQNSFPSVDPQKLAQAAQSSATVTPGSMTQSVGAGGGAVPLSLRFDWKDAVESLTTETSDDERRQLLLDQLSEATKTARLVVVFDDTDHFAAVNAEGKIDVDSINNLLRHGVGLLLEEPVGIVLAVHPAYRDVSAFKEITQRGDFDRVAVPALPHGAELHPLAVVLDRRLATAGYPDLAARTIFAADALAQLQGQYFASGRHDLRTVLRLCQTSALGAVAARASMVNVGHVQAALEADAELD